jgi:TolB-like protein/DNA-binding winged helix-turn-helix (wHTH) protein
MPVKQHPDVVRFGTFELDLRARELHKNGLKIHLPEQSIQILAMLLERPGEVVTREEIQAKLWPDDTIVEFDHSINAAVKRLRQALGDSADNARFVETLARRGYRFIAPAEGIVAVGAGLAPPKIAPDGESPGGGPRAPQGVPLHESAGSASAIRESSPTHHWSLRLVGMAVMLVVGLAVGWFVRHRFKPQATQVAPGTIRSLAVLPLDNLSGDPQQEYFADGMTEALIADLGQIAALRVISRTSVMRYKGTRKALPEIARELGVDAVAEGSVVREGNRVRITAQLVEGKTDRHLWAHSYDRDLTSVLTVQGEVAQAIANAIQIRVTPQEQARLARARPVKPEAQDLLLKGWYFYNKGDTLGGDPAGE